MLALAACAQGSAYLDTVLPGRTSIQSRGWALSAAVLVWVVLVFIGVVDIVQDVEALVN